MSAPHDQGRLPGLDPPARLVGGDCLAVLRSLPDASVDAIVTDPPYGLSAHPPAEVAACLRAWLDGEAYVPKGAGGFMQAKWDAWVPGPEVWREALRVLKPGGHCLAFAGTRSLDLMGLALRLAGFELRDSLSWIYGSGFPHGQDVSKAIDRDLGAEREVIGPSARHGGGKNNMYAQDQWTKLHAGDMGMVATRPATESSKAWEGWNSSLKPAVEPVLMARKPLQGTVAANVRAHGVGALHVDACRIPTAPADAVENHGRKATINGWDPRMSGAQTPGQSAGQKLGRYPANVILDGSPAVVAGFPQTKTSAYSGRTTKNKFNNIYGSFKDIKGGSARGADAGSAARFFPTCPPGPDDLPFIYCAKAGRAERAKDADGVGHTTVKPVALMRWLMRLVARAGSETLICDPFMGSGSTGVAARAEGMGFLGIEREPAYLALAASRLPGATVEPAPAEEAP